MIVSCLSVFFHRSFHGRAKSKTSTDDRLATERKALVGLPYHGIILLRAPPNLFSGQPSVRTKLFMDAVNFNNFIRSSKLPESMQVTYNEMS
ncbi:hypothetical protein MKW98_021503 [Papaver atlanticum]|uniref:Uncharacterized protein n=1 Tax=Papaver atlanticum TaxID=357466 RepID=A0AAD4SS23_9MAGN|nr:hypothetical protein MKW98_021503 [Papaver atlanticum]